MKPVTVIRLIILNQVCFAALLIFTIVKSFEDKERPQTTPQTASEAEILNNNKLGKLPSGTYQLLQRVSRKPIAENPDAAWLTINIQNTTTLKRQSMDVIVMNNDPNDPFTVGSTITRTEERTVDNKVK